MMYIKHKLQRRDIFAVFLHMPDMPDAFFQSLSPTTSSLSEGWISCWIHGWVRRCHGVEMLENCSREKLCGQNRPAGSSESLMAARMESVSGTWSGLDRGRPESLAGPGTVRPHMETATKHEHGRAVAVTNLSESKTIQISSIICHYLNGDH